MRRFAKDLYTKGNSTVTYHHYEHCLDGLRQDIMCKADDTPMEGNRDRPGLGDGQVMQCRDWDALIAWTQAPERHACHRLIDDYNTDDHALERFAFCPEWSPYRDVSRAYFEKWGHKLDPEDHREPISLWRRIVAFLLKSGIHSVNDLSSAFASAVINIQREWVAR